jgi:hypothetical protein
MEQPPSSTLSGFTPETLPENENQGTAQGKIELLFRFWGGSGRAAETGEPGGASHHPGVLALIEDAVASKRGVFVSSQEYLYISRLRRPADALVVSRQVQLGLEGFRARHGSGPVAVSIAIDASGSERTNGVEAKEPAGQNSPGQDARAQGQEPPHDLVTLLKLSKPAQILLTHDLCQQMTAIKGLPLKSFPARFGVYEYLWTAEEKLDLLQSEPQLTLAALPVKEKTGAGNTLAGAVGAATATTAATKAFEARMPASPAAFAEPEPAKVGLPRKYLLGGAGLAAIVVLAAIGIHTEMKPASGAPQNPAPVQAAPATNPAPAAGPPAQPASTAPTAGAAVVKTHTPPPKPAAAKPAAATPAPTQEAKAPEAPAAECNLSGNIPQYVGLAEQARGRGDYANAVRIFREVLACDPNNAAAREGLAKAMQAQQQPQ